MNPSKLLFLTLLIAAPFAGKAQDKFFTRNATVAFFSETPAEDIKAENFNVTAVLDAVSGQMEFSLLMKSFNFKKALMQEHFNENYMESEKFPKAVFKGMIAEIEKIDFSKDGTHTVEVSGDLTLHGVTKKLITPGTVEVKSGKVITRCVFTVKPEDYDIEIPSVVRDKIAREIEVAVNTEMKRLDR